jgi:hypothetical protein
MLDVTEFLLSVFLFYNYALYFLKLLTGTFAVEQDDVSDYCFLYLYVGNSSNKIMNISLLVIDNLIVSFCSVRLIMNDIV